MNRTELESLVLEKCASQGMTREKQANILKLLRGLPARLSAGRNAAVAGGKSLARKAALPVAAAGGAGLAGYSSGKATGDAAGYQRGSAEGGADAMRNLFRGLLDLRNQGSKSKTNLEEYFQSKRASADAEFFGSEKEAFIKALMAGGRLLGKGLMGGARLGGKGLMSGASLGGKAVGKAAPVVANQAGQAVRGAGRVVGTGLQGYARGGMRGAGQAMNRAIAVNPGQAMKGIGAMGLGAGLGAPVALNALGNSAASLGNSASQSFNSNVGQPIQQLLGTLGQAGGDIAGGFGKAYGRFGQG